jgi:hypothetical protein
MQPRGLWLVLLELILRLLRQLFGSLHHEAVGSGSPRPRAAVDPIRRFLRVLHVANQKRTLYFEKMTPRAYSTRCNKKKEKTQKERQTKQPALT